MREIEMTRYRRKEPVIIDAWRWTSDNVRSRIPDWLQRTINNNEIVFGMEGATLYPCRKSETKMGLLGDWIIRDEYGKLRTCPPHLFEHMFEPAE